MVRLWAFGKFVLRINLYFELNSESMCVNHPKRETALFFLATSNLDGLKVQLITLAVQDKLTLTIESL